MSKVQLVIFSHPYISDVGFTSAYHTIFVLRNYKNTTILWF